MASVAPTVFTAHLVPTPMPLVDDLLTQPAVLAIVAVLAYAALRWQSTLSWPEYRSLHGVRRLTFPMLDRLAPGGYRRFVNQKAPADESSEYLRAVDADVRAVFETLVGAGGSPHLVSAIKRRRHPDRAGGWQYSAAHVVWTHTDGTQTEAYLFRRPDGGTDVYAHHETSVVDPDGHLGDAQADGDPRGVVTGALEGWPR